MLAGYFQHIDTISFITDINQLIGVTTPDGLIISMYGPIEGRRHDATLLAVSGILDQLALLPELNGLIMYGDPAYGCREHLSCPFLCPTSGTP